jgi:topoisomerase IA-like protein
MAKSKKQKPQPTPEQPTILDKEDEELLGTPSKEKELLGYHPVTGEEIWK